VAEKDEVGRNRAVPTKVQLTGKAMEALLSMRHLPGGCKAAHASPCDALRGSRPNKDTGSDKHLVRPAFSCSGVWILNR
jgi:hypothetical protein